MDQEERKTGSENPLEVSSSPLQASPNPQSSGKDDSKEESSKAVMSEKNMDQEERKMGTENPPEVSACPLEAAPNSRSTVKDDSKEESSKPEMSEKNMDQEEMKMGTENPPEVSTCPLEASPNPQSTVKDDSKEEYSKPETSEKNMDQEEMKMGTENPPEVSPSPLAASSNPQSLGEDDSKEESSKPELSEKNTPRSLKAKSKIVKKSLAAKLKAKKNNGSMQIRRKKTNRDNKKVLDNAESSHKADKKQISDNSQQNETKDEPPKEKSQDAKNKEVSPSPLEASPNPQSSGEDDSKKESSEPELSEKNTPRSLKAKSKIVKKSLAPKLKAEKNNGSKQICWKKTNRENKKVLVNAESSYKAGKKQISDISQQNETKDEPPKKKSQDAKNKEVKESPNRSTSDKSPMEKSHHDQKNKKINPMDKTEQKQKSKEKHSESNKGSRRRKNKDKQNGMEKSLSKDKKSERLGGLIFMCSANTKPDCFRYRVMGVSTSKKDVVLQVKPGLKLFLYDFDLKLLYGIFKASSSGGMKLEPRAFSGNFPAQVRFNVVSDCFPLPESVFKKAIKDNYNEKHKFKTELTIRQVRKLTRLFQPVGVHSTVQPNYSPPRAIIRDREAHDGVRGSWRHSRRERVGGHRSEQREEIPHDSFLLENYQAYGLQGDRRNVATTPHVNRILEPYKRGYEHHLPNSRYRSNVPAHVESLRMDRHYLNDNEHLNYVCGVASDHIKDPYYAHRYGASSRDAYLTPLGREDITSSSYLVGGRPTDNLPRREIVQDRLYSVYSAADSLSEYKPMRPYHEDKLEASPIPVSFRYSFPGPPFSRR